MKMTFDIVQSNDKYGHFKTRCFKNVLKFISPYYDEMTFDIVRVVMTSMGISKREEF